MYFPIPLVVLILAGVWRTTANVFSGNEISPWWAWENVSEPVLAINSEELPYERPTAAARNSAARGRRRPDRPRSPPSTARAPPPLYEPTTNVTAGAANLRFYVCCVCIPKYSCTEGIASIPNLIPDDYDLNYQTCPYESDVCCPLEKSPKPCEEVISNSIKRSVDNPTEISGECECLHHELCPPDLVVRFSADDPRSLNSQCSNDFDVCCSLSDLPVDSDDLPPPTSGILIADSSCVCIEQPICDIMVHLLGIRGEEYISYVQEHPPSQQTCLNSSQVCCSLPPQLATKDHRLLFQTAAVAYNDQETCYGYFTSENLPTTDFSSLQPWQSQLGELPWGVLLEGPSGEVRGAGALIHPRVVLTVAHAFEENLGGLTGVTAVVGAWRRTVGNDLLPRQVVAVGDRINHPSFDAETMAGDIALLILTEPVVRAPHIQTICLAESLDQVDPSRCVASGWGLLTTDDPSAFAPVQKRIHQPVLDAATCQHQLRQTSLGAEFNLHNGTFCAGGTGQPGLCLGDQGGPLACPSFSSGQYLLTGALSGGVECGVGGVPDIFSSFLGPVQEWVRATIVERYGRLEEPLPRAGGGKEEQDGPGTTAGGFYYEGDECHGYEYREIEKGSSLSIEPAQSQLGELPWVALLLNTSAGMDGVLGAGALVHPRVVLTTATRVVGAASTSAITVVLGEWDRHVVPPLLPRQDHIVQEFIVHPEYNEETFNYDIALIILQEAAVPTAHVQSVCLATSYEEVDRTRCVVGGWGLPQPVANTPFVSRQKRISVPLLANETCEGLLRQTVLGPDFFLNPGYFCGGGVAKETSTCMGDEGGPLTCPSFEGGSYKLVGALSGGIDCGAEGVPDIFKSFTYSTYDWVRDTITSRFPRRKRNASSSNEPVAASAAAVAASAAVIPQSLTPAKGLALGSESLGSSSGGLLLLTDKAVPEEDTLNGSFGHEDGSCTLHQHPGQLVQNAMPPSLAPFQSQLGELPWVALLRGPGSVVHGVGALIHPQVVLTAANRVHGVPAPELSVVLGQWDRQSTMEQFPEQEHSVHRVIIHPAFNSTHYDNDLALIVLKDRAQAAPHVQSICLAQSLSEVDPSRCLASGWGTLDQETEQFELIMKRIMKPLIDRNTCERLLRGSFMGPEFNLPDSFFCGGALGGPSVCKGDEGAPLVCPSLKGDHYLLVGALSGGVACGDAQFPDIFSSVIFNNDWIRNTVANLMPSKSAGKQVLANPTTEMNIETPNVEETTIWETNLETLPVQKLTERIEVKNTDILTEQLQSTHQEGGVEESTCFASQSDPQKKDDHGALAWQVLVLGAGGDRLGLGALIHPRVVLTTSGTLQRADATDLLVLLPGEEGQARSRVSVENVLHTPAAAGGVALVVLKNSATTISGSPMATACVARSLDSIDRSWCVSSAISSSMAAPVLDVLRGVRVGGICSGSEAGQEKICANITRTFHDCLRVQGSSLACPNFNGGQLTLIGMLSEDASCNKGLASYSSLVADGTHEWIVNTMKGYFLDAGSFNPGRGTQESSTSSSIDEEPPSTNTDSTHTTIIASLRAFTGSDSFREEQTLRSVPQDTNSLDAADKRLKCSGYEISPELLARAPVSLLPEQSHYGESPWVVMLQDCRGLRLGVPCRMRGAGALIHPRLVLTTAHVVERSAPGSLFAVLGEWDRQAEFLPVPRQHSSVSDVLYHPDYYSDAGTDMAIVVLTEPAGISKTVQPICLARSLAAVDRSRCVVNGWGSYGSEGVSQETDVLKRIYAPVLDNTTCEVRIRQAVMEPSFTLKDWLLCGGGLGGPSVCMGDEGAPLVCPSLIGDQYLLVGALSGGIECGVTGIPDLYTSFLYGAADWAQSIIEAFQGPTAEDKFLEKSGLHENRFNGNWLGSRNFHRSPSKSNFAANVKDWQQTYVDGSLQGRSLLPFTNAKTPVNNKIETSPDKEPETSTHKIYAPLKPPTIVTQDPYPVANVSLQQEKLLKPSTQDVEKSNARTLSNNSNSSNSKSPLIVRASSVDTDSVKFRPFQHQARTVVEENETLLVSTASVYGPTSSPRMKFVSPSYSSIAQFRPRRVISSDNFSASDEEGEDDEFLCIGYENFGSGGVLDAGVSNRVSQFGELPWVALVLQDAWVEGETVAQLRGSGSLIHPRVVVTAAHIVARTNVNQLTLRLGEWDLTSDQEPLPHQVRRVARVIVHPHYDALNRINDIAVIILQAPVSPSPSVQPICLATSFAEVDPSRCITNGWSRLPDDALSESGLLKRLRSPLVEGPDCEAAMEEAAPTGASFLLHNSMVCAQQPANSTLCAAGSPLSCPSVRDGLYRLVGVMAGGNCSPLHPALYAAVAGHSSTSHYTWLKATVKRELNALTKTSVKQRVIFRR